MGLKRHNKRRNTALVYEFLIRHISKCLINEDKSGADKALDISKRYFSKGTLLNQELNLFNCALNNKVVSRHSAEKIVNEIINLSCKVNYRKLDSEKSNLIKEINHRLNDSSFYSYKIPNYTIYASMQTLLNNKRSSKKILDPVNRIKLEETIIEHLIAEKLDKSLEVLKVNPNYSNIVYKFVIEKFHEKYRESLNEAQKKILTKYAVSQISGNDGILRSALQKESKFIKEKLNFVNDSEIKKDKDLVKKLKECYISFSKIDLEDITEQKILDVLNYMKLAEEIDS